MIHASLCLLLIYPVLGRKGVVDDSVIIDSPLHDTTYERSLIESSKLTECSVIRSRIHASVSKGSTLVFSVIDNSTVIDSFLNVTYNNGDLDRTSTSIIFKNTDQYFFNRIYDSKLVNATLDTNEDNTEDIGYNSTVYMSEIADSKLRSSYVIRSHLVEQSTLSMSLVGNLTAKTCDLYQSALLNTICENSTFYNSTAKETNSSLSSIVESEFNSTYIKKSSVYTSRITKSMIYNSFGEDSEIDYSTLVDCTIVSCSLANSTFLGNSRGIRVDSENSFVTNKSYVLDSKIVNSNVTQNSEVRDSQILNAIINNYSHVFNSEIMNARVLNSTLTNCTVINSKLTGQTLDSAFVLNGRILGSDKNKKRLLSLLDLPSYEDYDVAGETWETL